MRSLVSQQYSASCGIACTAFVLGCSEEKALQLFGLTPMEASFRGVFCREIAGVLQTSGRSAHFAYLNSSKRRMIYQDRTIVYIAKSKQYPVGHYLVRWRGQWMDPWINGVSDPVMRRSKAGWRKRLPGRPIYAVFIEDKH